MTRNKKSAAVVLTVMLSASALAGCAGTAKTTKSVPAEGTKVQAAAPKTQEQAVLSGKVAETIQVGSYTYLLIEKDGKKGWSAIPSAEVKVGDQVELIPGVDMGQFTSPSLKRTFDNIHFSAGLKQADGKDAALPAGHPGTPAAAAALPPGHPKTPGAAAALPPGHPKTDVAANDSPAAAPAASLITGKLVETANAGGYTYICLEKEGKKTWAAIPATDVTIGKEMSILPGSEMTDFNSPTLKRTFDKIIFSPGPARN
jgi:hypothetical protein